MKSITKRIISTLVLCGALVLEAGATAIGSLGKALNNIAKVDAAEQSFYTLTFNTHKDSSKSGYASSGTFTDNDIGWKVDGANFSLADGFGFGGKSTGTLNRSFNTTTSMSEKVTKIEVVTGTMSAASATLSVKGYTNSDLSSGEVDYGSKSLAASSTFTFTSTSGLSNGYFKFSLGVQPNNSGSNKYVLLKTVTFYKDSGSTSTYTVTYDGNGNTGGSVPTDSTSYSSGALVTIKANTGSLVKTDYTFAGWNTQADGKGTDYAATGSATFTISANTTLYAKWTKNGGEEGETIIVSSDTLGLKGTSSKSGAVSSETTKGIYTFAPVGGSAYNMTTATAENAFIKDSDNGAIFIGKSGSYIYNSTAFESRITKFEIYYNKGAGAKTTFGVYFSDSAITAYKTGTNTATYGTGSSGGLGLDAVYDASSYLTSNCKYFWFQVTNANNAQVQFRITLAPVETKTLTGIAVKSAPSKTTYYEGETFNPAGLVITATYDDESTADIAYADHASDFSFSPSGSLATTDTNIVITYKEKTANQTISVNSDTLNSITLGGSVSFNGTAWDLSGVTLTGHYVSGDRAITSFTPTTTTSVPTKGGTYDVSVSASFGGKSDSKNYSVTIAKGTLQTDPLSVAEAIAISATHTNANVTDLYYVEGDVTVAPSTDSEKKYGNLHIGDSSNDLYVYGCTSSDGSLTKNGTYWSFTNPQDYSKNDLTKNIVVGDHVLLKLRLYAYTKSGSTTYEGDGQVISVSQVTVSSIAVTTNPTNSQYSGKAFDKTGMVVTATYSDASTANVTNSVVIEPATLASNTTSVTIKYTEGENTVQTSLTIDALTLSKITVENQTTEFRAGDTFSFDGYVYPWYTHSSGAAESKGSALASTEYSVSKSGTLSKGDDQEVTITHTESSETCSYTIDVDYAYVTGISMDSSIELGIGGEATFSAVVSPELADQSVTYSIDTDNTTLNSGEYTLDGNKLTIADEIAASGDIFVIATTVGKDSDGNSKTTSCKVSVTKAVIAQITSVTVGGTITATEQYAGKDFDYTGATFTPVWSEGSHEEVTITGDDIEWPELTNGMTSITGKYDTGSSKLDVVVSGFTVVEDYLKSITVTGDMTNKTYYSNATGWNFAGLSVSGLNASGDAATVVQANVEYEADLSPAEYLSTSAEKLIVTATYGEKTDTIEITGIVVNEYKLNKIEVTTNPSKVEYIIGETFSEAGLVVKATYSDGTTNTNFKGYTLDKSAIDMYAAGTYSVKVQASGVADASFNVKYGVVTPQEGYDYWQKVTSEQTDWTGEYLLVYENVVWTGVDAKACSVEIPETSVDKDGNVLNVPNGASTLTIEAVDGGYSVMVNNGDNDGKYIYGTSGSNKTNFGSTASAASLEYTDNGVKITSSTSVMRYNSSDNWFRFYKSSTYTGQKAVQLYKHYKQEAIPADLIKLNVSCDKTFKEGETLNISDLTVNGLYNDGNTKAITTGVTFSDGSSSKVLGPGDNNLTVKYGEKLTENITISATPLVKYDLSVTINDDQAKYTVTPALTDGKLIGGKDYTIEVSAKEGYVIESVTATGATVSGNVVTIANASSDVSITVSSRALAMFGITDSTDTYATLSNTATQVKEGTTYESDVTFATGKEPDTVSVTMGGVEVTGAYSNGHIKVENVSGDLVISITSKDVYFDVEYNFNHVSGVAISPETSLPEKVVYNGSVSFKVEPESGYAVDAGHIMVKEDGAAKTFSYDSTTGILTVSNVTNALEIAIDAFKLADVTKDLGDGLSVSHESSPVSINNSYTLELSLEDGKEITSVSVEMGGELVDDAWNASTLTVYIPTVTDDIEIKIETQTIQVPINANGNLVVSPEAGNYGSEGVTVTVSAKEGYVISGDLYYTIGDDDTQYPISGNSFTIDSLTQEINVYGETKEVYNIDFDLTDVTYSPNQDYILKDADSYVLVLSIAGDPSMYEIDMDSFKIEMNGHDITDYAAILEYSYNETTGQLTITFDVENLTDDIKVTAAQQLRHFSVNVDGDDDFVTLSGDTVIVYGETGSVILTPDDHYHFVEGKVIVKDSGSASVTLTKQDDGSVKIEFTSAVTGKINITVEVEHDTVSITAPEAGLENLTIDFQLKDLSDIPYDPNTPISLLIYAKSGFILPDEDGITVTCYGEVLVSGEDYSYQPENNLLIVYAIGDIEISGTASKGKSNVTVVGDEHVSFNGGEGLPEKTDTGLSFTATVEVEDGYRIDSIVVTMNGSVVKNAYVAATGTITVQNVTRDITITVVTVKLETISYDVENVTLSNTSVVVDNNSAFESTISFDAGYELTTVKVMMGGEDITATAYASASGVISIEHVTGAVEITVKATKISYDVTNTLTNVTNSNNAANIEYGAAYEATISVNEGYENLTVKVEMGGVDVTDSFCKDGVISIDSVTGELKITASATAKAGFSVTSSHDNATLTGSADGAYGYLDNYSVTVAANEGYNLTSIVVIVDGVAHPEFVNGNVVTISKVSGEVTVTVTCAGKPQELVIDIENVSLPGLPENIKYGDSINAEVEPEVGYSISSVKVYEDGVEKPEYVIYHPATKAHGSEAWYEIVIPEVKGSIKIEVESAPIDYSVDTTGLVNVVSTGAETATFDTTYTAKLTPATGFENLDNIKVYMNGVDVTSSVVFDNYIFIAKVTGAISIEATATEMEFTVSYDLTNVEIDAVAGTFKYSDVYEGNISYNEAGYTDFDIVIIVNGVDKTADYYLDGKITITGIKGDVVISASASPKVFDVINNNLHVGNTNLDNTVHYDESYHAEFEIDLGYENLTVQVLMGGEDVTADVYSNGVIDIAKVTGQIEITAEASAKVFDVDTDLSHVELSNDQTTAAYDSEFLCEVDAVEGYENVVITVLMDGEDVTDFVYENGVIFIEKVTGKIEITASASAKHFTVTYDLENVTSSSSVVDVAYDEAYSATLTVNEGYFDLQVTVTMNGSPVEVVNGVITIDKVTGPIVITASATKIELVSITAEPTTLEVDFDTTINPSDFVVTGHYNDGSDKVIDAESISGYDPHVVGEQTVTVNAGGKTCNVTVTVKVSEVIDHIEASTEKTTVDYGDSFTKEDVKVTYVYTDGHRVEGQPAESVTGFNTHVIGEQTLTVTAAGKETTLVINVNGHVIVSISAVGYDEYVDQGKDYVFNGTVSANYADGTSSVVTEGYEVSKVDTSGHGPQTAKVTYQGFSAEITINVIQTQSDASPTALTAIVGGAIVGVSIIAVGIFFFLKSFKLK